MAHLNDFMTRIDFSVLNDYVAAKGKSILYARGERLVQQGNLCRYVGIVKSGYFKYVALNSKGDEAVTGFSFEGEVVTDYVQGFLYNRPSLTSIVAGSDAEVQRVLIEEARRFIVERTPGFVAEVSFNLFLCVAPEHLPFNRTALIRNYKCYKTQGDKKYSINYYG